MLAECREEVLEVLKRTVRSEFLNRIDEIIMFEHLSQIDIREILRIQMRDLQENVKLFCHSYRWFLGTVMSPDTPSGAHR